MDTFSEEKKKKILTFFSFIYRSENVAICRMDATPLIKLIFEFLVGFSRDEHRISQEKLSSV